MEMFPHVVQVYHQHMSRPIFFTCGADKPPVQCETARTNPPLVLSLRPLVRLRSFKHVMQSLRNPP